MEDAFLLLLLYPILCNAIGSLLPPSSILVGIGQSFGCVPMPNLFLSLDFPIPSAVGITFI
jgi:hypothetical protein